MKKIIWGIAALIAVLTAGVCLLAARQQDLSAREAMAPAATQGSIPPPAVATEGNSPAASAVAAAPSPTPIAEDPAECARAAWEALYSYDTHEAPVRVLALLTAAESPGDKLYRKMLAQGKLQGKGAYYADAGVSAEEWTAEALDAVSVGLLDSIYAETPELALAAYRALRQAARGDSVEVICAGITDDVLAAMAEDPFSMGAAAGVHEGEMQVVYAPSVPVPLR